MLRVGHLSSRRRLTNDDLVCHLPVSPTLPDLLCRRESRGFLRLDSQDELLPVPHDCQRHLYMQLLVRSQSMQGINACNRLAAIADGHIACAQTSPLDRAVWLQRDHQHTAGDW